MSAAAPAGERDRVALAAAVAAVFGDRARMAEAYAELLSTDGITRGVLGPREADRVWPRHLFNSAALAELVPSGARVVDLGSGAGLPGIPLAIARPNLRVLLLEPMQRRVGFLCDCVARLELDNVEVVRGRAEQGVRPLADVVVARAVAPLTRLYPLALSLLVDGGTLLALKGAAAADEVAGLRAECGVSAEILSLPTPGGLATVIRVAGSTRPDRAEPAGPRSARGTMSRGAR